MLEQEAMVSCLVPGHLQENGSIITENFFISNIEELSNTPAIFCSQLLVPLVNFPSIVSVQGPSFKVTINYITLLSLQWQVGKIKYCTIKHTIESQKKICHWTNDNLYLRITWLTYLRLFSYVFPLTKINAIQWKQSFVKYSAQKGKRPAWIKFFRRKDTIQQCRVEEKYVQKFLFVALIRCCNLHNSAAGLFVKKKRNNSLTFHSQLYQSTVTLLLSLS